EKIRADLQLVVDSAGRLECEGSGTSSRDDLTPETFSRERVLRLVHRIEREGDCLSTLLMSGEMLGAPMIRLQSPEFEVRCMRDAAREHCRIPAWCDAAALHPDLDFDHSAQFDTELAGYAGGRIDLLRRVKTQRDRGVLGERSKSPQLAFSNHLIAHQNILDAATDEHFGFAHFLHALPHRAARDLPVRNGW